MNPVEIEQCLRSMVILYDTREHETNKLKNRLESIGCPVEREKLCVGDYSCKCLLPNGEYYSLADKYVIERKSGIDELCGNFTKDRKRFQAEFERAITRNIQVCLLVENASWEKIYQGTYRSRLPANALVASILAWCNRYNIQMHFCKPETSGKLIYEIMYRHLKERLETGEL